jgi:DNA repair protein SbcC/Rad50
MILRRLQLHPFAGSADREVRFEPGLNVVLGPNEAGKSTLRRALRQALLVSTKLSKREAESEVLPLLPLGGGDTIRVSLELAEGEAIWKLSKRWSPGNSSSELTRPDGGLVTEPAAVEETLGNLLGLTRGTWDHVLFAAQGEIGKSLDRLDDGGDLRELNERLRRAVFETDGVSLEKLAALIDARHDAAFGRWDSALKRPEGNRGLDQRWARGAGSILHAWYEREAARLALEEAENYYRRLDELNLRLQQAHAADETLADWVTRHEPVARDAEQRLQLEAQLAGVESRGKGLKEISQEWPVVANRVQEQEVLANLLREKAALLGQELTRAKAWESAEKSRRLLEDATKLQSALAAAKADLTALGQIDPESLARLEANERERDRLHARLEAASLRVKIAASRELKLETRSGVDEAMTREIAPGKEVTFEAGGRVSLRDPEGAWEIEVSSGEIDLAADEARLREIATDTTSRLTALGVPDLAAARQKVAAGREQAQRLALLEGQLTELLGSRSLEEWQAEYTRLSGGGSAPARSLGEVSAEHARTESEATAATREIAALRQKLAVWARDYVSADELLDRLGDLRSEHKALKQKLEALQPLPEGCVDAAGFLRDFRVQRETLEQRRGEIHRIQVEKAALVGTAPESEPAEAAERLELAQAAFSRALREGEAIERIRRDFTQLRAELDADTLAPWQAHLAEVLAPLTRDRYQGLTPDLAKAARADAEVPFAALSAGTRASFGLAVRLSMARWFLEGRDGFLLLDDPFVDLDPARQESAATLLRHFAGDKQVILFTCHPAHAALLGGHRIEL